MASGWRRTALADTNPRVKSTGLRRLLRKAREVGLFYTLTLSIRRVIPARAFYVGRTVLLQMRPQQEGLAEPPAQIRWAANTDADLLTAFGHPRELVQRRLSAGDRVCMLTETGCLLGYVWFHGIRHEDEALGVRFHLAPDEVWLFDAMIAPDRRGHGLYRRLLRAATQELWSRGVKRILIAIDASNQNSIHAHLEAGALPAGSIRALRLLGFTWVHTASLSRAAWTGGTTWLLLSTDALSTST